MYQNPASVPRGQAGLRPPDRRCLFCRCISAAPLNVALWVKVLQKASWPLPQALSSAHVAGRANGLELLWIAAASVDFPAQGHCCPGTKTRTEEGSLALWPL